MTDSPEDATEKRKTRLAEVSGPRQELPLQPYRGNEPFAFICYCDSDATRVITEISKLEALRLNCFFDIGDQLSSQWSDEFASRLLESKAFVYFISENSIKSQRCRRELTLALDSNKPIIGVFLHDIELPPGLRLSMSAQQSLPLHRMTETETDGQYLRAFHRVGLEPNEPPEPQTTPEDQTLVVPKRSEHLHEGYLLADRFKLEERLGAGGMSLVFKAKDTKAYAEPFVAVKVLNPDFAQHPDAIITLKRETAKTRQLAHPNIVNAGDFGVEGAHAFMWMEYLSGESLSERLSRNPEKGLDPGQAQLILEGVAEGLSYAHSHDIVHADFKPGNIMLIEDTITKRRQVKIIDFGIARAFRSAEKTTLESQTVYDPKNLGAYTAAYASIDLIENRDADPRDDVFALGCITYEMFTGKHPFDKLPTDVAMRAGMDVKPHPNLSAKQLNAVRGALAFMRDKRTASVEKFFEEFNAQSERRLTFNPLKVAYGLAAAVLLSLSYVLYQNIDTIMLGAPDAVAAEFADCWDCPDMVVVAAGEFRQGGGALSSQFPVRTVTVPSNFAVSVNEVTVEDFRRFAQTTNLPDSDCQIFQDGSWQSSDQHSWQSPGFEQDGDHPVTCVSWTEANAYAEWLSAETGQAYRLPSASEWEYLAQTTQADTSGCTTSNIADQSAKTVFADWQVSDCTDETVFTAAVGTYASNNIGINDMYGNVFEWVGDCWHSDYVNAPVDASAWTGSDCAYREARGGSWFTQPQYVNAAFRNRLPAETRSSSVGIRLARDLGEMN